MRKYADYSYKITGAIFDVRKHLGCGYLEKVYRKALAWELTQRGFTVEQEKRIQILYRGIDLGLEYFADLVVDDKIIIELKSVKSLDDTHRAQIIHYLKATGKEFGMLVNFGNPKAEIERFANDNDKTASD